MDDFNGYDVPDWYYDELSDSEQNEYDTLTLIESQAGRDVCHGVNELMRKLERKSRVRRENSFRGRFHN